MDLSPNSNMVSADNPDVIMAILAFYWSESEWILNLMRKCHLNSVV